MASPHTSFRKQEPSESRSPSVHRPGFRSAPAVSSSTFPLPPSRRQRPALPSRPHALLPTSQGLPPSVRLPPCSAGLVLLVGHPRIQLTNEVGRPVGAGRRSLDPGGSIFCCLQQSSPMSRPESPPCPLLSSLESGSPPLWTWLSARSAASSTWPHPGVTLPFPSFSVC